MTLIISARACGRSAGPAASDHPPVVFVHGYRSPWGVATIVLDFIQAPGLTDVTIVGDDTGGAICQVLPGAEASGAGDDPRPDTAPGQPGDPPRPGEVRQSRLAG